MHGADPAVREGFAAGEIIPETHTRGHERIGTLGTLAGVIVMLYLDVSLARERVAEPRTSTARGFGFERIMSETRVRPIPYWLARPAEDVAGQR